MYDPILYLVCFGEVWINFYFLHIYRWSGFKKGFLSSLGIKYIWYGVRIFTGAGSSLFCVYVLFSKTGVRTSICAWILYFNVPAEVSFISLSLFGMCVSIRVWVKSSLLFLLDFLLFFPQDFILSFVLTLLMCGRKIRVCI